MIHPIATNQITDQIKTLHLLDELEELESRLWTARDELDSLGRLLADDDLEEFRGEFEEALACWADLEEQVLDTRVMARLAGVPSLHLS